MQSEHSTDYCGTLNDARISYSNFSVLIVLLLHYLFPHTPCRWLHQNEMQFAYMQVGAALSSANYLCQDNGAYKKRL